MAVGITTVDDDGCHLFEGINYAMSEATSAIISIQAGDRHGFSAETLAKIFHIPHEEAESTLQVTT